MNPDKKFFKKIKGEIFAIELYYKSNKTLQADKKNVLKIMETITKDAWEDPDDLVKKWFDLLDVFIIAKKDGDVCGFVVGNFMKKDLVLLVASMVKIDKQSIGLGSLINSIVIKTAIKKRGILKIFKPFYFAFRTPNPILYSMVSTKTNIFPSLSRETPTEKEKDIFNEIVNRFSSDAELDEDNFIIKGAYLNYPKLIYQKDDIPWSNNKEINSFLDKSLKLIDGEGNTMVIVGKITLIDFIKSLL